MECVGPEHPIWKGFVLCKDSREIFSSYVSKNYCENLCDVRKLAKEKD